MPRGSVDGLIDAFSRGRDMDLHRRGFMGVRALGLPAAMDALRRSLDALLPWAERRGVAVGLSAASGGDSLGFPTEIDGLREDYAGAPLCGWRRIDREHGLRALGLTHAFTEPVSGADLADAAGLQGGLPPGAGEVDWSTALAGLDRNAALVLAAPRATEAELRRALAFLHDRYGSVTGA